MKHARWIMGLGIVGLIAAVLVSCQTGETEKASETKPPFGAREDVARAADLWKTMEGYTSWQPYPGKPGWQEGGRPHGKWVKYFINSKAGESPTKPGYGSIIIKENYGAKDSKSLGAVTVMQKVRGYDSDNADWFWVKFDPKGGVMKNPMGISLAGRVAKGMKKGCISCHSNADGNDFLYIND